MLINIPKIISPDLMKCLMEMGHSDNLLLVDANFPAYSMGKRILRAEGVEVSELLDAILDFFPLDDFVEKSVFLMNCLDSESRPAVWDEYRTILTKHSTSFMDFGYIDRLSYYEKSKDAYVIVQTTTIARYANIILQKGVI